MNHSKNIIIIITKTVYGLPRSTRWPNSRTGCKPPVVDMGGLPPVVTLHWCGLWQAQPERCLRYTAAILRVARSASNEYCEASGGSKVRLIYAITIHAIKYSTAKASKPTNAYLMCLTARNRRDHEGRDGDGWQG